MLFSTILLSFSIVGILAILIFKTVRPESDLGRILGISDVDLQGKMDSVKNKALQITLAFFVWAQRKAILVYKKVLFRFKKSKVSELVQGKGVIRRRENVTNSFLKDVKAHRDKIREELANGHSDRDVTKEEVKEEKISPNVTMLEAEE